LWGTNLPARIHVRARDAHFRLEKYRYDFKALKEQATTLDADLAYAAPLITGREVISADRLTPHLDDDTSVDLLTALVNEELLERISCVATVGPTHHIQSVTCATNCFLDLRRR
jgi:hypothetical protein